MGTEMGMGMGVREGSLRVGKAGVPTVADSIRHLGAFFFFVSGVHLALRFCAEGFFSYLYLGFCASL